MRRRIINVCWLKLKKRREGKKRGKVENEKEKTYKGRMIRRPITTNRKTERMMRRIKSEGEHEEEKVEGWSAETAPPAWYLWDGGVEAGDLEVGVGGRRSVALHGDEPGWGHLVGVLRREETGGITKRKSNNKIYKEKNDDVNRSQAIYSFEEFHHELEMLLSAVVDIDIKFILQL